MSDLRPVPRVIEYAKQLLIGRRWWFVIAIIVTAEAVAVHPSQYHIAGGYVATYLAAALLIAMSVLVMAVTDLGMWRTTAAFVLMAACGGFLTIAIPEGLTIMVPYVVASIAARRYPMIVVVVVNAAAVIAVAAPWLRHRSGIGALAAVTGLLVISLAVFAQRTRVDRIQQVERALALEQAAREEHTRAAALAERTRIAREVHDVLAHSLSALSLNLQGARLVLARDGASAEAQEQVRRAQRLAAEGLVEARRAVAALRDDPVPAARAIADLVTQSRLETGTPTELLIEGSPRDLSRATEDALFRTAQEALSNARKHAAGAPVRVTLAYLDGRTELTVQDRHGHRPAEATPGGYGLIGMRERAELIGGELRTGPTEDGWQVWLVVPT
jgi:signal transduction histidine kinase